MEKIKITTLLALLLVVPGLAAAEETKTFKSIVEGVISNVINPLVSFLIAAAVIVIIYGILVKFVASGDNEDKRKEGTKIITFGIIGLFVMVSVWGLVSILNDTFGLSSNSSSVTIPTYTSK